MQIVSDYEKELKNFIKRNSEKILILYGEEPNHLEPEDIEVLLNHTASDILRSKHLDEGEIGDGCIAALKLVPKNKRSVTYLVDKLAKEESNELLMEGLLSSRKHKKKYGEYLGFMLEQGSRSKMRESFMRLKAANLDIELKTKLLLGYVNYAIRNPSPTASNSVIYALRLLNRSVMNAHACARSGAIWAMRSGFSSRSVMKSMGSSYLHRMGRMADSFTKLDRYLVSEGMESRLAIQTNMLRDKFIRELEVAANDNELRQGLNMNHYENDVSFEYKPRPRR